MISSYYSLSQKFKWLQHNLHYFHQIYLPSAIPNRNPLPQWRWIIMCNHNNRISHSSWIFLKKSSTWQLVFGSKSSCRLIRRSIRKDLRQSSCNTHSLLLSLLKAALASLPSLPNPPFKRLQSFLSCVGTCAYHKSSNSTFSSIFILGKRLCCWRDKSIILFLISASWLSLILPTSLT